MIALKSGTVSLDRNIMADTVSKFKFNELKNDFDDKYLNKETKMLINSCNGPVFENGELNKQLLKTIKHTKAFSFIIDKKYGGLDLNVETQSRILVKLASHQPSLGVTVMVPNSLGPGELLHNYGTQEQKDKYLPKLANGEYIPCFGLTGPHNGSDAEREK